MSKTKKTICVSCENPIEDLDNAYQVERGSDKGKQICESCYSDDSSDAIATVVSCEHGKRNTHYLGSYTISAEGFLDEIVQEYSDSLEWKATDGWRGYFEGKTPNGWIKVLDTWFCGFDGTNVEGLTERFHELWQEQNETPDFPMLVSFLRTSNVFSTGLDIYIPAWAEDDFKAWIGASEEEADEARAYA